MARKIAVITASPNKDGLTAACGKAAISGISEAGAEIDLIDLNAYNLGRCATCDNGWGPCRTQHECQVKDDFDGLHKRLLAADGYIVVSPVYWGDLSESAKAFLDRVRRCEASAREASRLSAKPCIGVAAAGGSGNGTITCLLILQQFFNHVRSEIFDLVTITRKSRAYKLHAIEGAGKAMAKLLANG